MLHLRRSLDGGQTWSPDLRAVATAKNPSLAINSRGAVGFVYQQVVGGNWVTILETSDSGFESGFVSHTLAITPTGSPTPASVMATYLGDYIKLLCAGEDFFGVFCAGNKPDEVKFPFGSDLPAQRQLGDPDPSGDRQRDPWSPPRSTRFFSS